MFIFKLFGRIDRASTMSNCMFINSLGIFNKKSDVFDTISMLDHMLVKLLRLFRTIY